MNYTLVKPDGTIGATRDFDVAPTLAPNKGKWLPDNPPAFNPATHVRNRAAVQSMGALSIAYTIASRPPAEIAAEAAQAALQSERQDIKADAFVQQFVDMTPPQVIAYVNNNVANLADAKQLLTKLALMLLVIAKEQYK